VSLVAVFQVIEELGQELLIPLELVSQGATHV
jgi:hypothetical protein